jgi:hypothetical protein
MPRNDDQPGKRFRGNMNRMNGFVQFLFAGDPLTSPSVFRRKAGPRDDFPRAIVVFLHANCEIAFRCRLSRTAGNLRFCSRQECDKALKRIGVDVPPFRPFYPPLLQMAKRTKEFVHEAGLSPGDEPREWSIADDW